VPDSTPLDTAIVAVPETAGSALYGMVDVLSVTGNVWQTLTRTEPTPAPFRVHVVSVQQPHTDSVVRGCETWLRGHFREPRVVARVVGHAQIPERTLKRRFKQATGLALIDYVQNLRIEEAKHALESSDQPVDEICFATGYQDPSFFRRLFKRRTGVAPARYRRVFQPIHRGMPIVPHRRRPES